MTKQNTLEKLRSIEELLPYGAKKAIADFSGENKNNVQHAFRGTAGEDLTKKVYKTARKLYRSQISKARKVSKPNY